MNRESSRLEFLGQLAGGLAHEIKNPLSTMKLHLELMEEDCKAADSEQSKRDLRRVQLLLKEIRRLEEIVHEFLQISRGHDLKLTAVDLGASLHELVELVRPEATRKNVSLHLNITGHLATALVDENYFHRAMLNLVQNAIQACEPKGGGSVIIEAGRSGGVIGIAIIDTGVGIPEGNRDRIFRAYFTTRKGGTGMGLPMAKRIIEEHGGHIAFDTVEGQGSRFMVMLPAGTGESLTQLAVVGKPGRSQKQPAAQGDDSTPAVIDVPAVVNHVLAQSKETSKLDKEREDKRRKK